MQIKLISGVIIFKLAWRAARAAGRAQAEIALSVQTQQRTRRLLMGRSGRYLALITSRRIRCSRPADATAAQLSDSRQ